MSIRTRALTGLALLLTMSACADESTPAANGAGVSLRGPHENILLSVDPDAPEPEVLDLASVLSEEEIASLARDQDKTLFAASTRNRVANSGVSPYRSYVKVIVQWQPNQQAKACSGTLIRSDAVLTNAHCIYNTTLGTNGLPYRIQVIPGAYTNANDANNTLQVPATGYAWVGKTYASWTSYQNSEGDLWARVPFDGDPLRSTPAAAQRSSQGHWLPLQPQRRQQPVHEHGQCAAGKSVRPTPAPGEHGRAVERLPHHRRKYLGGQAVRTQHR
jgi:V8-like Glu-specific endopeptidase